MKNFVLSLACLALSAFVQLAAADLMPGIVDYGGTLVVTLLKPDHNSLSCTTDPATGRTIVSYDGQTATAPEKATFIILVDSTSGGSNEVVNHTDASLYLVFQTPNNRVDSYGGIFNQVLFLSPQGGNSYDAHGIWSHVKAVKGKDTVVPYPLVSVMWLNLVAPG